MSNSRWPAPLFCVSATIGAFLIAGCERGPKLNCQPVRGRVLVEGQPVAEALVVLHPVTPMVGWNAKPRGFTDTNGQFVLTTDKANDGAPPGEYLVTVELRAPREVGEELVRDGAQLLPERYRQPDQSGLRATVAAGENELPPFQLKKK